MWVFVFFDMPVVTKKQRKKAARFRKNLQKCGFNMMQYSVYVRECGSYESAQSHIKRVKSILEDEGRVNILMVTDKQISKMEVFWSGTFDNTPVRFAEQLEMF